MQNLHPDEVWLIKTEERIKQDPETWAYLQHQRNPRIPPIDRLPQPGDVIRSNGSPCELMVKRVYLDESGTCFECRVIHDGLVTHHKSYQSGFDLKGGRLLCRRICGPGTTGFNIHTRGQEELFILRRAKGQLDLFAF